MGAAQMIGAKEFDAKIRTGKGVALLDFWASWCHPCKLLGPTIEALAVEYGDRVLVGKCDVDENGDLAQRFNLTGVPTVILFKDGMEVDRVVGLAPKPHFDSLLRKHLGETG
jgi:thioredoxin 1